MADFIGNNIRFLRNKKGISQQQLALQVDKGYTTIGNWEKGVSEPNLTELVIIAKFFGVTTDEMLNLDLSNVDVNQKTDTNNFGGFVDGIVERSVDVKGKKGAKAPYLREETEPESFVMNDDGKPYGPVLMPRVVTIDTRGEENSVFVPVKARAGYLLGYGDAEFIGSLPTYKMPGGRDKTYRVWEVDGNSMFNTLHDKDLVNAYWVRLTEIRDGRVYVLVTRTDGIIIKRVINRIKEGILVCKSDNNHKGDHPPIILNIHDILEVWYVEGNFTRNLAPPGEIYDRMLQLEAEVALIKHNLTRKT